MDSWTRRNRARGGMTLTEFEAKLLRLGFVSRTPRVNIIADYTHPDTGPQLYSIAFGQRFSDSLPRILAEYEAVKAGEVS